MIPQKQEELNRRAHRIRSHIIKMATNGGCFIGASLSCVDILNYLYSDWLKLNPADLKDFQRDYLLLSKGHDVPALYGVFVEIGFMEPSRLGNHLNTNDHIYWHPNRKVSGVEFHSGSLGHLLSVGLGIAIDMKLRRSDHRVVVILGDGELNEGSIWEAVLVAAAKCLDNLVVVVDRNGFQANVATEDLIPLEPLEDKFRAFGWETKRVDGHDYKSLEQGFNRIPVVSNKPTAVIADTVRGKGLPSLAGRADRWFCNFSQQEVEMLLSELAGECKANIHTKGTVVR